MLERARGPLVAQQRLLVKFDQDPARIEAATGGEFAQRRRRADLPRMAVDEDAEALLDRVGPWLNLAAKKRREHKERTGEF